MTTTNQTKELFTQGEWFTDTNKAGDYTQIKAHPNKFLCEVDGRERVQENEANARLFAQAKNMYYALQSWQKWAELQRDIPAERLPKIFDKTPAILQKANPQQ